MSADDLAAQLAALKGAGAVVARFHENGQLAEVHFVNAPASTGGKARSEGDSKPKRDPLLSASRMRPGDGA